jgi:hypothetical protein
MKILYELANCPLRFRLATIAVLSASAIVAVLQSPSEVFFFVLALGMAFSALGGYWLGARWFLVPLVAMAVEIAIAVPITLIAPYAGETPISVVLEAPFWTGMPAFIGALFGAAIHFVVDQHQRRSAQAGG